jgi:hypothetical protein
MYLYAFQTISNAFNIPIMPNLMIDNKELEDSELEQDNNDNNIESISNETEDNDEQKEIEHQGMITRSGRLIKCQLDSGKNLTIYL